MKQWWQYHQRPLLALVTIVLLTSIPFVARWPFNWDAAQFTLGVEHFSVHMHQPHPPGYPLFIVLGKLLALVFSAHTSLLIIALGFGCVAVVAVYLLVWSIWGQRWVAFVSALAFSCNPLFWLYRETALTYTVDAASSIIVAGLTYQAWRNPSPRYWYSTAVVLGIASGFRPSLLLLLLPLLIAQWVVAWRQQGWLMLRPVLRSIGLLVVIYASWFIPLVLIAGGWSRYWVDSGKLYGTSAAVSSVLAGAPWSVVWEQIKELVITVIEAWNIMLLPMLGTGLLVGRRITKHRQFFFWSVVWLVPSLVVYSFVHFGQVGYSLTILPFGYIVATPVWLWLQRRLAPGRRYLSATVIGLLLLVHSSVFLLLSPSYAHPEYVPQRRIDVALQTLARHSRHLFKMNRTLLNQNDAELGALYDLVRRYDPSEVVIMTSRNLFYPARSNGLPVRNDEVFRELSAILPDYVIIEVARQRDYWLQAQHFTMSTTYAPEVTIPNTVRFIFIPAEQLAQTDYPSSIIIDRFPADYGHYYLGVMTRPWHWLGWTIQRQNDL